MHSVLFVRTAATPTLPLWRVPVRAGYVLLALLAAVSTALLYTIDPREPGTYPLCPFLGLTGYHCPGCGTLRALHMLLHGDPVGALGYNALAVLALPSLVYTYVRGALHTVGASVLPRIFVPSRWIWALLVGVLIYWALRNLPLWPLSSLAP